MGLTPLTSQKENCEIHSRKWEEKLRVFSQTALQCVWGHSTTPTSRIVPLQTPLPQRVSAVGDFPLIPPHGTEILNIYT